MNHAFNLSGQPLHYVARRFGYVKYVSQLVLVLEYEARRLIRHLRI